MPHAFTTRRYGRHALRRARLVGPEVQALLSEDDAHHFSYWTVSWVTRVAVESRSGVELWSLKKATMPVVAGVLIADWPGGLTKVSKFEREPPSPGFGRWPPLRPGCTHGAPPRVV